MEALLNEDSLMELCLQLDIDDYQLYTEADGSVCSPAEEGHSVVIVSMEDMVALRDALRASEGGGHTLTTKLVAIPKEGYVSLSDADFDANLNAIAAFESLEDVDSVEHNIDMTDVQIQ